VNQKEKENFGLQIGANVGREVLGINMDEGYNYKITRTKDIFLEKC